SAGSGLWAWGLNCERANPIAAASGGKRPPLGPEMNQESGQDQDDRHAPAQPGEGQGEDMAIVLQEQIEALKGELEQVQAQSLIERADLDNQRKRMARELESARRFANERLLG